MIRMAARWMRAVCVVVVACCPQKVAAYGQSLSDCKAVAAKFLNTCEHGDYDTPATTVSEMASQSFACENKPKCIPDGTLDGTTCTWERRLCVTCRVDNGITKIRVQTNNLPNHCVQSTSVKPQNFDYEVIFNSVEKYGEWEKTIRTQTQLDNAVCPIVKRYDAGSLGIVELGEVEESSNAMGIAINGIAFQFANQIREDPVYPITVLNEQPLDICLGHNQQDSESGMYHYHDVSPCINPDFLQGKTMSDCASHDDCKADIAKWALSGFDSMKTKTVIGIAKDGHVLYGPYDDNGQVWATSGVDACNGAWSTDQADYFYVSTQWHPYLVGCLGPANFPQNEDPSLYAQCSLNGMDQYIVADDSETTTVAAGESETTTVAAGDSETTTVAVGDSETTTVTAGESDTTILVDDASRSLFCWSGVCLLIATIATFATVSSLI